MEKELQTIINDEVANELAKKYNELDKAIASLKAEQDEVKKQLSENYANTCIMTETFKANICVSTSTRKTVDTKAVEKYYAEIQKEVPYKETTSTSTRITFKESKKEDNDEANN